MRHILGISALYHDSAAALLSDGEIVAAAQETPQKPAEPVSEKLEFPDWMKKAQKMAGEKKTRFKDIPALKIHESATAVDVKNALIAWRISVSEGQKNAGDQWVLEQFATILPQEVPA